MNTNNKPIKIFFTGATGYIGGSVLSKLLQPSHKGQYDITVLTRSEATLPKFKELGVTPLLGDLDSADILTKAAIDADIVFQLAYDHLPGVKALIEGLNTKDGKRRIYIHTSGTGVLRDESMGNYASEKIYNDLDMESIHALPLTQPHKDIDAFIFENNQNFESIIVCPPTIYGLGSGPFNRHSVQIPAIIRGYLQNGKASTVGKGLNIWGNVHVDDLANFFELLLEKALEGKADTGKNGWYFCVSGEHVWGDVVVKIAEELYKKKAISSSSVTEFTKEELETDFGKFAVLAIGGNSRSKSDRARQLGWKPDEKTPNIFESIEDDVKLILEKEGLAH